MFSISLYVYSLYTVYTANEDVLPHQKALSRHLTVHQDQIIVNAIVPQHPWGIDWFLGSISSQLPCCSSSWPSWEVLSRGKWQPTWEGWRGKAPAWVPPAGFPVRCFVGIGWMQEVWPCPQGACILLVDIILEEELMNSFWLCSGKASVAWGTTSVIRWGVTGVDKLGQEVPKLSPQQPEPCFWNL